MQDSQELVISIDRRLAEARREIASLEAALAAMSTKPTPTTTTTKAARKAPATVTATTPAKSAAAAMPAAPAAPATGRRARRPRQAEVVPAGKLEALLGSSDGLSMSELVRQTGGDRQQLLTLLRELEARDRVRRSGERRSTRWHVITDEDRIAARVAELERQRTRPAANGGSPRKPLPLAKVS